MNINYDLVFDPNNELDTFLMGKYFVGCDRENALKIMFNITDFLVKEPLYNVFDYIVSFDDHGNRIGEIALVKTLRKFGHHKVIKEYGLGDVENFTYTFIW